MLLVREMPDSRQPGSKGIENRAEVLTTFMIELREQCAQALTAFAELRGLIGQDPPLDDEGRRFWNRRVWLRIHGVLAAGTAVSNILWPNPANSQGGKVANRALGRATALRVALSIEGSPPRAAIRARNAFAHVDERLDEWLEGSPRELPMGWVISSLDEFDEPSWGRNAFRYYHANRRELRIGRESCSLTELVSWIESIDDHLPHEATMVFKRYDGGGPPEL
ncbi:MAG TPA: hypothetical protein VGX00_01940 [Thermoplasmata archaeon]|nr:hypothetical protein [Thermoplasmata archaeon]